MPGKQVTELDALPSFTDTSLLPVHNGAGLKKGLLSQLASYLGSKFSNPNLLINPDFKINQRGATSYEQQGYSVDRWKIWNVTVTPNANEGITVKNDKYTDIGTFLQYLENATEGDSTLSCYVTSVSGTVTMVADDNSQVVLKQGLNVVHTNKSTKKFTIFLNQGTSITLKWVKLEQGKVATSFVAPNQAEELIKCYRFYQIVNIDMLKISISGNQGHIPFMPKAKMRCMPTIGYLTNKLYMRKSYTDMTLEELAINRAWASGDTVIGVEFNVSYNRISMLTPVDNHLDRFELDAEIY